MELDHLNVTSINASGNVGIGTTNPQGQLHISSGTSGDCQLILEADSDNNVETDNPMILFRQDGARDRAMIGTNDNHLEIATSASGYISFKTTPTSGTDYTNASEQMRINSEGQVGIGKSSINSVVKLHVAAGSGNLNLGTISYFVTTSFTSRNSGLNDCSILADNDIVSADAIGAYSDRRIKKNIVEINDASSLEKLRLLKPSYYEYIDPIKKNYNVVEGFIAQEVKEIMPYAVKMIEEVIPNIFQRGNCELDSSSNYIVTLSDYDTANLEVDSSGNIYPELKLYDPSNNEIDTTIKEVVSSTKIRVESDKNIPSEVFVYGQHVDNFNYLQKERVFTVGISALQEVDRQQQADKAKIATLETENATLKTQMADVLARLAALESA
jgi:hypothetical protein